MDAKNSNYNPVSGRGRKIPYMTIEKNCKTTAGKGGHPHGMARRASRPQGLESVPIFLVSYKSKVA